jgi:hypothetical protein
VKGLKKEKSPLGWRALFQLISNQQPAVGSGGRMRFKPSCHARFFDPEDREEAKIHGVHGGKNG